MKRYTLCANYYISDKVIALPEYVQKLFSRQHKCREKSEQISML